MNGDDPRHPPPPSSQGNEPTDYTQLPRDRPPLASGQDAVAITNAGAHAMRNDLSLAVADAGNVISSMPLEELRWLAARVADDAFDQLAAIRKAIAAANRHDLVSSFQRIADAWEASIVARISIAADSV